MPTTEEYLNSLKRDKQNIINSIKAKGTNVPDNATFTDLVGKVDSIETGINTSDATVTTNDIKLGKTAYAKDTKLTGTLTFDTFGSDYDNCLNAAKQIEGSIPLKNPYFIQSALIDNPNSISGYIKNIPLLDFSNVTSCRFMFNGFVNLKEIPLLNTSNVTDMFRMFRGCKKLTSIPLLNTSKVTDMGYMFENCQELKEIPSLDTSNVTDMSYMFYECKNLTTIPPLDTSKVTNMSAMFIRCYSLTFIPELNISNVTNMRNMFQQCTNLQYFNGFKNIDLSSIKDVSHLFNSCSNLIEVKGLEKIKVKNISGMFYQCTNLNKICDINGENITDLDDYIFYDCANVQYFNGFKNIGQAYNVNSSENNYNYNYSLYLHKLTHESLINVINNLYDIKSKGVKPQKLQLGSTSLAKLTPEEIAIATNKGWNVS